ncbi:thiazole synthase [Teredinibacter purpureus]|uniref:thiazole synthase n=1 Tax=Teredinibacter purpureus TaxID=2731756 RepID=UPI0005F7DB4E|nr:thiazole synthase [Teredinibacter purpureus]
MEWTLAGTTFNSRIIMGSGKFGSVSLMRDALQCSGTECVTVALKRVNWQQGETDIVQPLQQLGLRFLPNTSGARNADEAVYLARLGRELFDTPFIKLEIHPDQQYLMPDPLETYKAAAILVEEGFHVLPYIHADPVLCKRLEALGCAAVMPLAAPIGSNQGVATEVFLRIIIEQSTLPVIIDAGLGAPSHAAKVMEMGATAVMVNTAIATAHNPATMAEAFKLAVTAGRYAYTSGLASSSERANATSPLTTFLESLT